MSKLLLRTEDDFEISPSMAVKIGLNETIIYAYIKNNQNKVAIIMETLCDGLPFFARQIIERALESLKSLGYIRLGMSPEEKKTLISSKYMNGYGIGNKICEWCGCKTMKLHNHHYPIQKKDAGTDTVNVCATCHQEFHSLNTAVKIVEVNNNE